MCSRLKFRKNLDTFNQISKQTILFLWVLLFLCLTQVCTETFLILCCYDKCTNCLFICFRQHMKDCTLSRKQLFQDILSYNLELIGCSEKSTDEEISTATGYWVFCSLLYLKIIFWREWVLLKALGKRTLMWSSI